MPRSILSTRVAPYNAPKVIDENPLASAIARGVEDLKNVEEALMHERSDKAVEMFRRRFGIGRDTTDLPTISEELGFARSKVISMSGKVRARVNNYMRSHGMSTWVRGK